MKTNHGCWAFKFNLMFSIYKTFKPPTPPLSTGMDIPGLIMLQKPNSTMLNEFSLGKLEYFTFLGENWVQENKEKLDFLRFLELRFLLIERPLTLHLTDIGIGTKIKCIMNMDTLYGQFLWPVYCPKLWHQYISPVAHDRSSGETGQKWHPKKDNSSSQMRLLGGTPNINHLIFIMEIW